MTALNPQSQGFFEDRYLRSGDPWNFATSTYELERYQVTLGALERPTYRRAYEPGCSIGLLTAALAQRCEQVCASDIAPTAVALARDRCRDLPHVILAQADLADGPPEGSFDLIVFSEIGYYFSAPALRDITSRLGAALAPGGEFVAVHWLGISEDHVLHGSNVHEVLGANLPCSWIKGSRHSGFIIDSWRRS